MHVAMVTVPMMGHLMPLLPYAEELLRRGHEVTIFHPNESKYRTKLEACGLHKVQSVQYNSQGGYDLYDLIREHYSSRESDEDTDDQESQQNTNNPRQKEPPSLLVYDFFAVDAGDAADSLKIPSISVFPNMAVTVNPWATTNPNGFVYSNLWCKIILPILEGLVSRIIWMKRSYTRWNRQLPMLSEQDVYPTRYYSKQYPILGCTSPLLEYNSAIDISENQFVPVGPAIPSQVEPLSQEVEEWLEKQSPNRNIVYIAFGTMYKYSQQTVQRIESELEKLEQENNNVSILWSLPKKHQQHLSSTAAGKRHWKIVPFCAQVSLFRTGRVSCFVTHCGSNSVYEALLEQVPMVTCPGFADQPGNAMRLQRLQVGVLVQKLSLQRAIQEVLQNLSTMKQRLAQLVHDLARDENGAIKAVTIMEQIVQQHHHCHQEDVINNGTCRRTPWWPFSVALVSMSALIAIF